MVTNLSSSCEKLRETSVVIRVHVRDEYELESRERSLQTRPVKAPQLAERALPNVQKDPLTCWQLKVCGGDLSVSSDRISECTKSNSYRPRCDALAAAGRTIPILGRQGRACPQWGNTDVLTGEG